MVTRGSPKPLFWVRVLVPLPEEPVSKETGSFFASFSGMSWKQTLEKYTHTVYTYLYGAYDAKDYI